MLFNFLKPYISFPYADFLWWREPLNVSKQLVKSVYKWVILWSVWIAELLNHGFHIMIGSVNLGLNKKIVRSHLKWNGKIWYSNFKLPYTIYNRLSGDAFPPENCGGVWGYQDLLKTISDPDNDEYESTMEWLS